MSYLTPRNNIKQYAVVDINNKVLKYFRLSTSAKRWAAEQQHYYFDKLKVIINDKL